MVDRFNGIKPEAMKREAATMEEIESQLKKPVEIETRKKKSRNPCGSPLIIKISTK
jgi:hypothetical protein